MTTISGLTCSSISSHRSKTRGTPYLSATALAWAALRWQTATTWQPLDWKAGMWARPKPSPMMPTVGARRGMGDRSLWARVEVGGEPERVGDLGEAVEELGDLEGLDHGALGGAEPPHLPQVKVGPVARAGGDGGGEGHDLLGEPVQRAVGEDPLDGEPVIGEIARVVGHREEHRRRPLHREEGPRLLEDQSDLGRRGERVDERDERSAAGLP